MSDFLHLMMFRRYVPLSYSVIVRNWKVILKPSGCPNWCGLVGWVLSCKVKGHWFDSQSGHVPGLWVWFPVRHIREAASWCFSFTSMFLFFSFSPASPLSKIKLKSLWNRTYSQLTMNKWQVAILSVSCLLLLKEIEKNIYIHTHVKFTQLIKASTSADTLKL